MQDSVSNHIHAEGEPFTIIASLDSAVDKPVAYFWRDVRGRPLSIRYDIPGNGTAEISSPRNPPTFVELVLVPLDEESLLDGHEALEVRTFGFAVLPQSQVGGDRSPRTEDRYGVVHASLEDPFLPAWVKTMTWMTFDSRSIKDEISAIREAGAIELPIVVAGAWSSDDSIVVSDAFLEDLRDRAATYFAAHTQTVHWEVGIEENLTAEFHKPFYWTNLALKSRALRDAANLVNPDVRLIYQVAETGIDDVAMFLHSGAAANFDVLSLHPYAWPDFVPPEGWLPDFLETVKGEMAEAGREMPIWFTEIGAPERGNHSNGFFGYPDSGTEVPGLSRLEVVGNLIKMHVVAFQHGVEKVFWYNYRDRGNNREYVEDFFGLVDVHGFPKPAYVAYVQLREILGSLQPLGRLPLGRGLHGYRFGDWENEVIVIWDGSGKTSEIEVTRLTGRANGGSHVSVIDAFGMTIPADDAVISLTDEPIYVVAKDSDLH